MRTQDRKTVRLTRDQYEAIAFSVLAFDDTIGAGSDTRMDPTKPRYADDSTAIFGKRINPEAVTPCCIHGHALWAEAYGSGEISRALFGSGLTRVRNDVAVRKYARDQGRGTMTVSWAEYHKLFRFEIVESDGSVVEAVL